MGPAAHRFVGLCFPEMGHWVGLGTFVLGLGDFSRGIFSPCGREKNQQLNICCSCFRDACLRYFHSQQSAVQGTNSLVSRALRLASLGSQLRWGQYFGVLFCDQDSSNYFSCGPVQLLRE